VNAEGKPYEGNLHVRFDEGLLARTIRTAGWGLLHHHNVSVDRYPLASLAVASGGRRIEAHARKRSGERG
jgi:hypothetical protein